MAESIKIMGLYKGTTKDGKVMLSGNLNDKVRVLIFQNSYKKEDTHPDFLLYLAPREQKEAAGGGGGGQRREAKPERADAFGAEEIPF